MIVNVDRRFINRTPVEQEKDASEMIMLLQRGHFLLMEPDVKNELYSLVESNLLTWQKEIFNESDELLTPTVMMKRWLTTINFYDYTERQRRILLQTPSELLVENGHNEWPVYKRIIHAYKENNTYSSVFGYIEASITNDNLKSCHLGGKGEIPATLVFKETDTEFQNLYRFKVCVLFDRDTDNNEGFSRDNSRLFMKLCNKDFNTVDCNDIYKLDFGTGYIWHSWYKRAIENYFPKSEYEKLGINMDDYPSDADSYDYIKFPIESTKEWQKAHKTKKEKKVAKYEKDLLSKIGSDMNMGDYEVSLKKFNVDGINLSELELFLFENSKNSITMKKISIRPEREYLREIIKKMENGLYVIPAFQRDFVWLQRQIIDLFDSIIKGYPIGTLILWKPSGESYRIKNVVNDNIYVDNNKHVYILDGRQRLTAFYCCVLDYENKPGKFNLYFNLEKESFEFQNNKLDYDKSVLVSEVYDTFRMLGILQQFMEIEDVEKRNDYIKKVKELNTILQSYEIGEIELDDCSLDEAGEVFSRINSKGTDISKVEMLQAVSYKSPDNVLFAEEIKSIINSLEEFNFSDIRTDDLLNCCYRYINKYFFEDTNLKLLTGADLNDIVIRLRTDIHKTVDFLYNECNVLSYRHLPYTRQLIAICSFFSEVKDPSNAQLFELKKWFYYTTANQSFQNSSLGNVRPLFYRFNKFLRGEIDTAIDYDVVELNSAMDFKYSNSSALSNLIFMCTIEHAKKTCNMQDIQYLGDYKYSKSKPSTTFIMLKEDDRRQLNLLLNQKKRVDAMPHILLDDEMIEAYLSGQEEVLEKLRTNMIIDNLTSCLKSLGIEYCFDNKIGLVSTMIVDS